MCSIKILATTGEIRDPIHQWCKSLMSIGGDNLQFCPIFDIGGDEPRPRFFSGEQIK